MSQSSVAMHQLQGPARAHLPRDAASADRIGPPESSEEQIHAATRGEYSDAEIAQRVRAFLTSRHFPAFRQLHVDVHNGSVSLQGKVHSYYEKQVALNTCQRVAGVLALIDQVLVELDEELNPTRRLEAKPR